MPQCARSLTAALDDLTHGGLSQGLPTYERAAYERDWIKPDSVAMGWGPRFAMQISQYDPQPTPLVRHTYAEDLFRDALERLAYQMKDTGRYMTIDGSTITQPPETVVGFINRILAGAMPATSNLAPRIMPDPADWPKGGYDAP